MKHPELRQGKLREHGCGEQALRGSGAPQGELWELGLALKGACQGIPTAPLSPPGAARVGLQGGACGAGGTEGGLSAARVDPWECYQDTWQTTCSVLQHHRDLMKVRGWARGAGTWARLCQLQEEP